MEEILLVDINDSEMGYSSKEEVHKLGMLHRAFSVFLFNGSKMLVQKRSINKYHSGGLWTNACCSHQRKYESLEDAVKRCLHSELGIETECKEMFHFIYRTEFSKELFEYELDHVFVGMYNGKIELNKEEAEEIEWIDIQDLKDKMLYEADQFTSWFIIAAPKVLELMSGENV